MTKVENPDVRQPIAPSGARYIKLGAAGCWERLCIEEGTLRLGYYEVPHESGQSGDVDAIRKIYLNCGINTRVATGYTNQICDFYQASSDILWVTFADGFLWWCFADPEVIYLGSDVSTFPDGSRFRRATIGWSNKDIKGNPLRISELNGQLTSVARFQGTICNVNAFDYLVRKINDDDLPEIVDAKMAKTALQAAICDLLTLLTWQDFETLTDLIFAKSGWQRIGVTGGVQKTVDLELLLPTTGERAFVQVKSKTNQAQLDDYIERLSNREEARMFYVYHSTQDNLNSDDPRVILVGPSRLSEMVLEAGLLDWLMLKVS